MFFLANPALYRIRNGDLHTDFQGLAACYAAAAFLALLPHLLNVVANLSTYLVEYVVSYTFSTKQLLMIAVMRTRWMTALTYICYGRLSSKTSVSARPHRILSQFNT